MWCWRGFLSSAVKCPKVQSLAQDRQLSYFRLGGVRPAALAFMRGSGLVISSLWAVTPVTFQSYPNMAPLSIESQSTFSWTVTLPLTLLATKRKASEDASSSRSKKARTESPTQNGIIKTENVCEAQTFPVVCLPRP